MKLSWISFPAEEQDIVRKTLEAKGRVLTTRCSRECGKYQLGESYITPWGTKVVVAAVGIYSNIEDHPYFEELTDQQRKTLSKYPKFELLSLWQVETNDYS